ncbi:MAG TPA: hypothetical protein VI612_03905 [Candidatus Nanoarchaeia archaeon]|nr:hypothetical protein [Candidatus Nanoarchaeia archaeon]
MAEIPWWAWLGVGLFVAFFSLYLDITLFGWVGLFFIIIGIAKLVYFFVFREREEKPKPTVQHQAFYCPRCRFAVHAYDLFCRRCGARLR